MFLGRGDGGYCGASAQRAVAALKITWVKDRHSLAFVRVNGGVRGPRLADIGAIFLEARRALICGSCSHLFRLSAGCLRKPDVRGQASLLGAQALITLLAIDASSCPGGGRTHCALVSQRVRSKWPQPATTPYGILLTEPTRRRLTVSRSRAHATSPNRVA